MDTADRYTPALLEEIKSVINVTWEDEFTEKKITALVEDGMSFLDRIAGKQLNFEEPGEAKRLLKNYCRYAYAGAESEFKSDYQSDLAALNINSQIEEREKKKNEK